MSSDADGEDADCYSDDDEYDDNNANDDDFYEANHYEMIRSSVV